MFKVPLTICGALMVAWKPTKQPHNQKIQNCISLKYTIELAFL